MTDGRAWVWCVECGPRSRFEFHNPETVYCSDCGQIVGETTERVETDRAALNTRASQVVDPETGDVHCRVEWDTNRVETKPESETDE